MVVVLQCGQELVKFLSYIPHLTLHLITTHSQKIQNKLSGRKFALFDDVISAEKDDLGSQNVILCYRKTVWVKSFKVAM